MALQPPAYETGAFGDLPVLDAVAVALDEGGVTLFAVNWDQATPVALAVEMRSLPSLSAASHGAISGGDPDAVNTLSSPDRVVPKTLDDPNLDSGACRFNRCRRRLGAGTYEGWPKSRCPAATPPGLC